MRTFHLLSTVLFLSSVLAYADSPICDTSKLIAGRFVPLSEAWSEAGYFSIPGEKTREQTLEDTLVEGWTNLQSSIDVRAFKIPADDTDIYFAILNRHPELFYVKSSSRYSSSTTITEFFPSYFTTDEAKIASMQGEIDAATANALSFIPEGASALEKALILHDFLATHCDYKTDLQGDHIRDIYGALVERAAVCAGYAVTYSYLLSQVGVACDYIVSSALNHAWSLVTLDGIKYHVDVTWDDPVWKDDVVRKRHAGHENFLLSDSAIKATGHTSWDNADTFTGTDTRYESYFWKNYDVQIPSLGGFAYVITTDGKLEQYRLSDGQLEATLATLKDKWKVWGDNATYTNKYAEPILLNGNILYNGPTQLYLYSLKKGSSDALDVECPTGNGYIYGLYEEAPSQIQAYIAQSPNKIGAYYDLTIRATPVESVSLDTTEASLRLGLETLTLHPVISPGDAMNKTVTWSSSAPEVAAVSTTGVVTPQAAGTAVITVTTEDGGKTATCTITVTTPVASVTLATASLALTVGESQTLTATLLPADATNKTVTWSSSTPAVASVDSQGVVTAHSPGEAVITVTTEDGSKTATCQIAVVPPVTGVTLDRTSAVLAREGSSIQLVATVLPENATNKTVTWSSSAPEVATVSTTGVVTPQAAGTAVITVTTEDGGKTATCSVTVTNPVTGVSLTPTAVMMEIDEAPYPLQAVISPSDATTQAVTWSSSNPAVASVDSQGVVTAHSPGETVITVTTQDGSKTATCNITVAVIKNRISLIPGWNLVAFQAKPTDLTEFQQEIILECGSGQPTLPASLEAGKAYWFYSSESRKVTFTGSDIADIPCEPTTDGSFIGISGEVPEWDLQSMTIYGWNGEAFSRLTRLSQLKTGAGYWVKRNN